MLTTLKSGPLGFVPPNQEPAVNRASVLPTQSVPGLLASFWQALCNEWHIAVVASALAIALGTLKGGIDLAEDRDLHLQTLLRNQQEITAFLEGRNERLTDEVGALVRETHVLHTALFEAERNIERVSDRLLALESQ